MINVLAYIDIHPSSIVRLDLAGTYRNKHQGVGEGGCAVTVQRLYLPVECTYNCQCCSVVEGGNNTDPELTIDIGLSSCAQLVFDGATFDITEFVSP